MIAADRFEQPWQNARPERCIGLPHGGIGPEQFSIPLCFQRREVAGEGVGDEGHRQRFVIPRGCEDRANFRQRRLLRIARHKPNADGVALGDLVVADHPRDFLNQVDFAIQIEPIAGDVDDDLIILFLGLKPQPAEGIDHLLGREFHAEDAAEGWQAKV